MTKFGLERVVCIAALAGLLVIDKPGVQIGVDAHLFSRHGIQREAGRHFGNSSGESS